MALHPGQVLPAGLPHSWHSYCMAFAQHAACSRGQSSHADSEGVSCDAVIISTIYAIGRWLMRPSTAITQDT